MKNRTRAIPAEAAAIPPKPKTAATIATTRKISVQRNMIELHILKSILFTELRFQNVAMVASIDGRNNPRSSLFWKV